MTLYEYKKGLSIQLNKDDIESLADLGWLEIGNPDAEMIVGVISSECRQYLKRKEVCNEKRS